ncbi:MAG: folate-binding protein YgfZ [Anaerolineales bacterium]|nr:folate-binding protein YgfZ [Anaerolineales bacterium]
MNLLTPVYYLPPVLGLLRLTGPDRLTFLQRQTTNDVTALTPAHAVTTVLTSATARILDVLQLLTDGDTLSLIPLPGHAASTYAYLRRRIFFNDNVTLTDVSTEFQILDLEGATAGAWLRAQGLEPPLRDACVSGTLAGIAIRALGQPGLAGIGYRIIAPAGAPLVEHFHASFPALSPAEYEIYRVEAGLPAAGRELTEDYTPHETNLAAWISETKGCYTGQEILARQVTYDKITRHMVGLKLDAPAQPGATVLAEGKPVGTITSAVVSPRVGPIALAILKRPSHEPGTPITVQAETGVVSGVVSAPFA